ncbi:hypothetical protein [Streptomyces acidicola]|uniref:hypothetical protein n=1 Tax=Streptomyces acidicola TaxID=2596892 RepID=UPI003416443D
MPTRPDAAVKAVARLMGREPGVAHPRLPPVGEYLGGHRGQSATPRGAAGLFRPGALERVADLAASLPLTVVA